MIQFLFYLTIFLQSLDAFITYFSVSSGQVQEINPIMSFLIFYNWIFFFIFKALGTFLILYIAYNIKPRWIQISTLGLINFEYIGIFFWNIYQILLK